MSRANVTTVGEVPQTNIIRKRGDTKSINLSLTDSAGAVLDITGFTFTLSVTQLEAPESADYEFQSTGTITDGPNGRVSFPISAGDSDRIGDFFYDIEMVDGASEISTILEGNFTFIQDRGK